MQASERKKKRISSIREKKGKKKEKGARILNIE